jgi:guanine deaminase
MEAKFSNIDFARRAYESVVRRVIDCGVSYSASNSGRCSSDTQTTTCCYYGTSHLQATKVLADIINAHGIHNILNIVQYATDIST